MLTQNLSSTDTWRAMNPYIHRNPPQDLAPKTYREWIHLGTLRGWFIQAQAEIINDHEQRKAKDTGPSDKVHLKPMIL